MKQSGAVRLSGRSSTPPRWSWLVAAAAIMLTAACRETRAGRNAPKSVPTSTAEVMTQPIPSPAGTAGTPTSQPAQIAEVEVMLAVGAPWGLDGAPRMPFEARRVTEVFGAMPMRLDGLGRVAAPAEHGDAPVLRYVDADGMSVVTIVPRLFPLQATAPEFVRRLAREFRLVAATGAVDVSDTARLVYVAGGFVGAEPPIHGLIWAYSDRGFAFVLTSTSAAARELVVRALVETLQTSDAATAGRGGPLEARPTCSTNAAGDNLKC